MSMHIVRKEGKSMDTSITKGYYRLIDSTLIYRWEDMSEVRGTIKFIDKNTFEKTIVDMVDSTKKDILIFRRN